MPKRRKGYRPKYPLYQHQEGIVLDRGKVKRMVYRLESEAYNKDLDIYAKNGKNDHPFRIS